MEKDFLQPSGWGAPAGAGAVSLALPGFARIALGFFSRYACRGDVRSRLGLFCDPQGRLDACLIRCRCRPVRRLGLEFLTRFLLVNEAFAELAELWARRDRLDEAEWTRLYELVMDVLASSPPGEEWSRTLSGEAAQAWRNSFFVDKVLMPATAGNAAMSRELTPGGLPRFYRNYLRDQMRKVKRRREYQGYEGAEDDLADSDANIGQPVPDWCGLTGVDADGDANSDSLADAGLDAASIEAGAREFLAASEDWVVVYLALHFCGGRDRLPLSKIHQQFQIPSYHHKARQLGIAPPRGGYEELAQFESTMIGRWLKGLGIELIPEKAELIQQAFDFLCLEAFRQARSRGLADLQEAKR